MSRRARGRAWVLTGAGLLAGLGYAGFVLDWVLRGFDGAGHVVSELAAPGEPHASLLRALDTVCAGAVLVLVPGVRAALPAGHGRVLVLAGLLVFAAGVVVAAYVTVPCGPASTCSTTAGRGQLGVHDVSSVLSDIGLLTAMAAAWAGTRGGPARWFARSTVWAFCLTALTGALAVAGTAAGGSGWTLAAGQRLHILAMSAWLVCLGLLAAQAHRPAAPTAAAPRRTT